MIKSTYKDVCRRVRRLPLDLKAMLQLKKHVKNRFASPLKYKPVQRDSEIEVKSYKKFKALTDEIIKYEDWGLLNVLFDYVYKDIIALTVLREQYDAFKAFGYMNYNDLRDIYPTVHLFKHLPILKEYLQKYDQQLSDTKDEFSVAKFFNIKGTESKFKIRIRSDNVTNVSSVLGQVQLLYNFLLKHKELTNLSLQPFEVAYLSDKFGRPMNIVGRDKLLQEKLTLVKSIIHSRRPITRETVDNVGLLYNGKLDINPNFFKHMGKKHLSKHKLRKGNKKFIPTEKNIIKVYKEYFATQCYYDVDSKSYKPNPLLYYE